MSRPIPDLRTERELVDGGATFVAGMDEVGRGAIAGPVMVGVVVIDRNIVLRGDIPSGLADSKLEPVREWCVSWSVGVAEASEIDAHGIMTALQLAGQRALSQLTVQPDVVIVDGPIDWLTENPIRGEAGGPRVVTQVKADQLCASVAAASIVSKVQRDQLMVALHEHFPAYGWASNKGYGSALHRGAIKEMGACDFHRRTWNLS
jgi:ribonuclease HII